MACPAVAGFVLRPGGSCGGIEMMSLPVRQAEQGETAEIGDVARAAFGGAQGDEIAAATAGWACFDGRLVGWLDFVVQ